MNKAHNINNEVNLHTRWGMLAIMFLIYIINQHSYLGYLVYGEGPRLDVGYPTPKPVSAPFPLKYMELR